MKISLGIMKTLLYYLGIAALFTHELDAVLNMEWRLLYHLRTLPDITASSLFVGLHFPLFFTLHTAGISNKNYIESREPFFKNHFSRLFNWSEAEQGLQRERN